MNPNLKFKTNLTDKSQLLLKALYHESTLTFLRFAAKHCSIAHDQLFGGSYQLYGAISCIFQTLQRKIVEQKRKTTHCLKSDIKSGNKIANYQKYNSEKQSRLRPSCFCFFSRPLIYGFWRNAHDQYTNSLVKALLIALQVVKTSFGFHLRGCMGISSPSPCSCCYLKSIYLIIERATDRQQCLSSLYMITLKKQTKKKKQTTTRTTMNYSVKRVSMGWWILRLSAKILALLRLSFNFFQLRLTKKLKINFFCFKKLNIN